MPRALASVLNAPMFIAQEPHTPSRQERRKVSIESIFDLLARSEVASMVQLTLPEDSRIKRMRRS